MPTPYPNETFKEYMPRCMSDPEMREKYPDSDQRYVVCRNIYKTEGSEDADE
jgi:hypothetical protein